MERRFSAAYVIALVFAPVAAALRLWSLIAAVDGQGIPVMSLPYGLFFGAAGVFLLLALYCAIRSPGRGNGYGVFQYGQAGFVCGAAAGGMIILGSAVELWEALKEGATAASPILALLGLVGGVACIAAAGLRRQRGKRYPAAEVLPIAYLLIKLVLNFKEWSTDPIILDYCVSLFALIFTLLSFYLGGGFVFDKGRPRRALFCAMAAVFFCAGAIMDGIIDLSLSTAILFGGFLLWQLPMIWDLLAPSEPVDQPEEKGEA